MAQKKEVDPRLFKIRYMVRSLSIVTKAPKYKIAALLIDHYNIEHELSAIEISIVLDVSRTAINYTIEKALKKLKAEGL